MRPCCRPEGAPKAAALLGEPITVRLVVAVATVAAGIVLVNRRKG